MSKRIITLGKWNDNPIEWIVLKEESFGTLISTKYSIGSIMFDIGNSDWENSHIRIFLNGEFWKKAFNYDEKTKIVNVKLQDVNNTKDDVFLISKAESDNYLTSSEVSDRGYWCTRTKANSSEVVRYSGGWGRNTASAQYEIYPTMYIKEK